MLLHSALVSLKARLEDVVLHAVDRIFDLAPSPEITIKWIACLGVRFIFGLGQSVSVIADTVQVLVQSGHTRRSVIVKFWDAASIRKLLSMWVGHPRGFRIFVSIGVSA